MERNVPDLIRQMLEKHLLWAEKAEYRSYDWWDIWGTSFGGWAKTLYLKNKIAGLPFVAPIIILDLIYPSYRSWFVQKRSFPICHAHYGLGLLNLFEITSDKKYLDQACSLIPELLKMASPKIGPEGMGWGMKHQWMTVQGLVPADTPCNTQTAYPYEFFCRMHDLTGQPEFESYLEKIAHHVFNDFREWREGNKLACSYSTIDNRRVINANSYRMMMMLDAGARLAKQEYTDKGLATLRYILSMQNEDGSWPYSEDQSFIDCYHTVFVLKNLMKAEKTLKEPMPELKTAIENGYAYFLKNLFDAHGYPKPFSVQPRTTIFRYDAYDLSECIGLFSQRTDGQKQLQNLIKFAHSEFQTSAGWFVFRIYKLLPLRGIPYIRYANSNMFYALTKSLKRYV